GEDQNSGMVLFRETPLWVTAADYCAHEQQPLPLALQTGPCIFRRWALEALSRQGRTHRVAYTSLSTAGLEAAIRAGLAVGVVTRGSLRPGLRVLTEQDGFPPLPAFTVALRRAPGQASPLLERLEDHLLTCCLATLAGPADEVVA
ncbi:MAG: LysR substrate-binding domain-containing protein, partial [Candidatus Competibacterales bacterium]|nr:LysR substrate-binding domain-containing protein [Candidatus Competibacterales bacterium]